MRALATGDTCKLAFYNEKSMPILYYVSIK